MKFASAINFWPKNEPFPRNNPKGIVPQFASTSKAADSTRKPQRGAERASNKGKAIFQEIDVSIESSALADFRWKRIDFVDALTPGQTGG